MRTHRSPFPWALSILTVVTLGIPAPGHAQRAFRTGVEIVPLTVTVTDGSGTYVTNLAGSDFTVLEDGVPQSLAFFASEQVPVDLALVLDVSSSMGRHLPLVRKAAGGLLRTLRTDDQVTVIGVNGSVAVLQPLTTDHTLIDTAIRGISASGGTALYNGLYIVLKEFERERRDRSGLRRQAIVVLSDGLDTASHIRFEEVMELAQRVGVNIYVVSVPSSAANRPRALQEGHILQAEYAMRSLAREAGGRSFFPKAVKELPAIYGEIAQELAHQYELGYFPAQAAGDRGFRRVTVRVENAVARTRSGYHAGTPERRTTSGDSIASSHSATRR